MLCREQGELETESTKLPIVKLGIETNFTSTFRELSLGSDSRLNRSCRKLKLKLEMPFRKHYWTTVSIAWLHHLVEDAECLQMHFTWSG